MLDAKVADTISLEEVTRISYTTYVDPTDSREPSFCILDWTPDLGRWSKYCRDLDGVRWHGPYGIDPEAEKNIHLKLEPVAAKLGVDLNTFDSFANINVQRLVEEVAAKLGTIRETGVAVYKCSDGKLIYLKPPSVNRN